MTGVLHPIGPEPERTYWVRRAVLLAVVIVLVGGLIAVAATLGRGAQPAAGTAPVETPAVAPTESTPSSAAPTQTPAATAAPTPTPTATPTASASDASANARASASASPGTSSTARPSPDTSSAKAADKSGEKAGSEKSGSQKSTAPTSSASPTASAPTLCAAGELTAKVSGDRTLKVDQNTTFTVSLANGGATTCTLAVAPSTFELKIYSGTDRIWTTKDCTSAVKPATATLRPEQALTWQQSWNGRRSASGCKTGVELPRPGVYWATAQYAGAKPTQLRMIVS